MNKTIYRTSPESSLYFPMAHTEDDPNAACKTIGERASQQWNQNGSLLDESDQSQRNIKQQ